jgi:hypothetical protein
VSRSLSQTQTPPDLASGAPFTVKSGETRAAPPRRLISGDLPTASRVLFRSDRSDPDRTVRTLAMQIRPSELERV